MDNRRKIRTEIGSSDMDRSTALSHGTACFRNRQTSNRPHSTNLSLRIYRISQRAAVDVSNFRPHRSGRCCATCLALQRAQTRSLVGALIRFIFSQVQILNPRQNGISIINRQHIAVLDDGLAIPTCICCFTGSRRRRLVR